MTPLNEKLISVQYLRALAALLVVWAHLAGFGLFSPLTTNEFGGFGVDIFFVISGFIMWTSGSDQAPAAFALRRIARIVPTYWFYTSLLIALCIVAPRLTPNVKIDLEEILCSFLFVPHVNQRGEVNPILLQGWTLNCEMYFYLIFGLALFLKNKLSRFLSVTVFFCASTIAGFLAAPEQVLIKAYTDSIFLEFVFGMGVSVAANRWRCSPAWCAVMVIGSLLALWVATSSPLATELRVVLFGVPSALALYGLLGFEEALRLSPTRILIHLGDASYSLYLVHPFVLSAAAAVLGRLIPTVLMAQPVLVACLFGFLAMLGCCLAAVISYRAIERPSGTAATAFLHSCRHKLFPG